MGSRSLRTWAARKLRKLRSCGVVTWGALRIVQWYRCYTRRRVGLARLQNWIDRGRLASNIGIITENKRRRRERGLFSPVLRRLVSRIMAGGSRARGMFDGGSCCCWRNRLSGRKVVERWSAKIAAVFSKAIRVSFLVVLHLRGLLKRYVGGCRSYVGREVVLSG
jgi:hypothetical protein